jgi:phage shock protein PspC (stress-responsive transcriptional regulator)/signal transduction histidine kinase
VAAPLTFPRRSDRRVLAGVAGGFADHHGLDAVVARCAIVVLSFAGGLGVVLYAVGAVLSAGEVAPATARVHDQRRNVATACVTLGIVLLVRSSGLWLGDTFMWPLVVAAAGVALIGVVRPDLGATAASPDAVPGSPTAPDWPVHAMAPPASELTAGRHARARLIIGAGLVSLGVLWVGSAGGVSSGVRVGAYATALTIIGVALVLGPWLTRLAQQAAAERRERIRVAEREAMAAHLHDSVLQTLALIQRTADDPRRTITLARQQERELRAWLYGTTGTTGETLDAAVRAVAHEIEVAYDVRVELVVVGDAPMDTDLVSFLAALREACVNAAKHSGVDEMAVFVEVMAESVEAFVRDRGRGFDRGDTAADRRGIAQSIEARLTRLGGTAAIDSTPGEGTEVRLALPHRSAAAASQGGG